MVNFQDSLYRHGSLSTVWLVGIGAPRSINPNSKVNRTILRVDIRELCDALMNVATIPDRVPAEGDGYENFMDIKKLSILLYGLYQIHKLQIKAFKKRLDEHYVKLKWQILNENSIDLPLPTERRRQRVRNDQIQSPTMNMVQDNFGEFNFDAFHNPLLAGEATPRLVRDFGGPTSPFSSSEVNYENIDLGQIDIINILKATKASSGRKSKRSGGPQVDDGSMGDAEVLNWLGQSKNVVDRSTITMREDDLQMGVLPRNISHQYEDDFTFEGGIGGSMGFMANQDQDAVEMNPPPPVIDAGGNVDMEIAVETDMLNEVPFQPNDVFVEERITTDIFPEGGNFNQNLPQSQVAVTPAQPVMPINPIRLAQRINLDRIHDEPEEPESAEPARKRSRRIQKQKQNQGAKRDQLTAIPKEVLRAQITRRELNEDQRIDIMINQVAKLPKKTEAFPLKMSNKKKALEIIQNHRGRRLGVALTDFLADSRQHLDVVTDANLDEDEELEVERRRSERSGQHQNASSFQIDIEGGVAGPEGKSADTADRQNISTGRTLSGLGAGLSEAEEQPLQSGIGTSNLDINHQGISLRPDADIDVGFDPHEQIVAEEMPTPMPPGPAPLDMDMHENDFPPFPDLEDVVLPQTGNNDHDITAGLKTFSEFCPPETTTRIKAASEFLRLLKLQKDKKLLLIQNETFGPIFIKTLSK